MLRRLFVLALFAILLGMAAAVVYLALEVFGPIPLPWIDT